MKPEWVDAVKKSWEKDAGRGAVPVARIKLPSPARDAFDELEREARAQGAQADAARFTVEGKNVFVVRAEVAGATRFHLYDAAGHLAASGETSGAATRFIGRN